MSGHHRRGKRPQVPAQQAPAPASEGTVLPQERGRRQARKPPAKKQTSRQQDVSLADRLGPTSPPSVGGSVLPGGSSPRSRRLAREQRKKQSRQRWGAVAIGVVAVVAVGLLAAWWLGREDAVVAPEPDVGRTERTVTLTIARPGEPATSGALLVADGAAGDGGVILVSPRVFVSGPSPERIPFGDTVTLESPAAPGNALADSLDVIVDGSWQLTPAALAALVDQVGGVLIDVDSDILTPPGEGQQRVVIAAGEAQQLDGAQTVAFVEYLGPGEPQELRLARLGQVIDQLAQKLPSDPTQLASLLTQTAAVTNTTATTDELADFLVAFGAAASDGDVTYQTLPTKSLETPGPQPASVIDPEGAQRLRDTVLAGSVPEGADGAEIQVLVENGVGTPGLEQGAAALLRAEGYQFVPGGNAATFDTEDTVVLIPDTTPASLELGYAIAETLGLPQSAVQTTDQGSTVADVIVILGVDFVP